MHHLQRKILESLTLAETKSYSEVRPPRVESNQFAYHLKQLIRDGYVEKLPSGYRLSAKGMALVDRVSKETYTVREQPKIVTLLDITNSKGETMMYRRLYQPYYGKILFPTGKIHMGERVEAAAQREMHEKLGLENTELKHMGMVYVAISMGEQLVSHVLCHVFHGESDADVPENDRNIAQRFWADHTKIEPSEYLPGFLEIKDFIARQELFFTELFFDLSAEE